VGPHGDNGWRAGPAVKRVLNWIQNLNRFKFLSNPFKIYPIQKGSSPAQKIEIKYCVEGFEEGNNFLHRNFFKFKVDFERKIREVLGF
jgi:hypothetical protein